MGVSTALLLSECGASLLAVAACWLALCWVGQMQLLGGPLALAHRRKGRRPHMMMMTIVGAIVMKKQQPMTAAAGGIIVPYRGWRAELRGRQERKHILCRMPPPTPPITTKMGHGRGGTH